MKNILIVIAVLILVGGGFILFQGRGKSVPAPGSESSQSSPTTPPSDEQVTQPPSVKTENEVTYSSNGFTPKTLTVTVGTEVTFINTSSDSMWVASNPHPIHADYSGFDARRSYGTGESYTFTFTKKGTWGYHNHRDPGDTGTVVVE